MNVIAYDPYINEERAKALGVTVGSLDDIIAQADFITVHMPLTKETRGMISMAQMRRMKQGVRLVNCARGGIIHEHDLAEAVREGIVAGAAIDVFESEPLAEDSPLRNVPGIVLTPHLGASTVEAQIGVSVDVAQGIRAALRGEPVLAAVNMAPVSKEVMRVIRPYIALADGVLSRRGTHLAGRGRLQRRDHRGQYELPHDRHSQGDAQPHPRERDQLRQRAECGKVARHQDL